MLARRSARISPIRFDKALSVGGDGAAGQGLLRSRSQDHSRGPLRLQHQTEARMKLPTITGPDHSEQQALHAGRKRGLVWRLAPVLALTVGAILWLGWQFWALHEETERIRTRDFRLVELSGT